MTKITHNGEDYIDVLLALCKERNDMLGSIVEERLLGIRTASSDLVAAEARYHRKCKQYFCRTQYEDEEHCESDVLFESLCGLLSNDKSKIWNSHKLEMTYYENENMSAINIFAEHSLTNSQNALMEISCL